MVTHSISGNIRVGLAALAVAVPLLVGIGASPAAAQQQPIYAPGEPIVTGFSGVLPPSQQPPSGIDPLDLTFINPDGASMLIQQLQPDGPPQGQLIPSPPVFEAKASDVGQVFSITLDDAPDETGAAAPNIYLAASSAFGLNLVVPDASGNPIRTKVGAPNAQFMPGQWGMAGGQPGGPGTIYRVDGTTGQITPFATIPGNTGAGLGNIVFDAASQQFFVSDLDNGLIYRVGTDGTVIDSFDHGVTARPSHSLAPVPDDGSEIDITNPAFSTEDPATWGFTAPERKVYGLAVHGGRLYYAVAAGPQIWSVGINADGSFAGDARWELDVTGLPSTDEITNIVFDPEGRMILAQRGAQAGSYDYSVFAQPQTSSVVRYTREVPDDPTTPSTWVETPDSYAIGFRPQGTNASGGIALGYPWNSQTQSFSGSCSAYLWSTGDSLRDASAINPPLSPPLAPPAQVHGLQGNDRTLVRPQNDPPLQSYFADFDGNTDDSTATEQGHVGDVEIWQKCQGVPVASVPPYIPPPNYVPPPVDLALHKYADRRDCYSDAYGWSCGYLIRVTNVSGGIYWGPLTVDDWLPAAIPGAHIDFGPAYPWSCGPTGPGSAECTLPGVVLYPGESVDLHARVAIPKTIGGSICWLDNSASLVWRSGRGDSNPNDDFGFASAHLPGVNCGGPPTGQRTNLRITKYAQPADCALSSAGATCNYIVDVTNTGPGVYTGPIQVKDTVGVPATVSAGGAPWACSTAGPTATCNTVTSSFLPGSHLSFAVQAQVSVGTIRQGQICAVPNKAQIIVAPGGSPLNFNPADDTASAAANIDIRDCQHGNSDMSLTKTGLKCSPLLIRLLDGNGSNGGSGAATTARFICSYQVTIKNLGPAGYSGPLGFSDQPNPPSTGPIAVPGLTCTPAGGGYNCVTPGNVTLPAGASQSYTVNVGITVDGRDCTSRNRATLTTPAAGSPANANPANDTGGDSIAIQSPLCGQLPPPVQRGGDLSISKQPVACARTLAPLATRRLPTTATGQSCFAVTITNDGTTSYSGPLHFTDQFGGSPTSVTPSGGGLICVPTGSGASCGSTGPVNLAPGASKSYTVVGTFSGATAGPPICQVHNTATLTFPVAGSPANENASNDTATATGSVTSAQCNNGGATLAPLPPGPPQQCPAGTIGTYPDCRTITINPGRPPITLLCPEHSHSDGRTCVCDDGFSGRPGPNPLCKPIIVLPPPGTHLCPDNSHWDGRTCVCNDGFTGRPGPNPVCRPAINLPPPGVHLCPDNSHWDGRSCVCNDGFIGRPGLNPVCRPVIKVPPVVIDHVCPAANSHWNGTACVCDDGYRGVPSRGCFKPTTNGEGNNPNGGNPNGTTNNNPGRGIILNVPPKGLTLACPADSIGPHMPDCRCKPPTVGKPGHCEMPGGVTLQVNPGLLLRNQGAPPQEVIR